ncbi:MAG: LysM peptidoglycan-binding domain-containing protein [Saprospiraceae bacterium]
MKTTFKFVFNCFLFVFLAQPIFAQCPPASQGHHRVQKGETLYQISKKYNVSVDQLSTWNNIQPKDFLIICQELWVVPNSGATPTSPTPPSPVNNIQPQGGSHRIKQGETIAGLAELYGYTEQKFREFNGLSPTEPAWPGLVLRTSDCFCEYPSADTSPVYVENGENTSPNASSATGISPANLPDYPSWEETIAANESPASNADRSNPFGEDPFIEGAPKVDVYNQPDKKKSAVTLYNDKIEKITAPNSPSANATQTEPKSIDPKVKQSVSGSDAPIKTYLTPEEELIRKNRKTETTSPTPTKSTAPVNILPSVSKDASSFMKEEEIEMIDEINLVRSNPAGYVKYIAAYKQEIAAGRASGSIATCDELISELKITPPLPILQPLECLYNAAKKHGEDQRPTGSTDHVGTDGSYPWDRVRRECPNLSDGRENIVGGPEKIRDGIILLLVDHGITNRGHRRTILDKSWKYVACYKIGQVGRMPNSWIQDFAK